MKLDSLHIKNFRILEDFEVKKLGRLNLVVGENNSGKSSVLEAIRIYAGNANSRLLDEISRSHDEPVSMSNFQDSGVLPFESFFTGRRFPQTKEKALSIGERGNDLKSLKWEHIYLAKTEEQSADENFIMEDPRNKWKSVPKLLGEEIKNSFTHGIHILKNNEKSSYIIFDNKIKFISELQEFFPCRYISTRFMSLDELATDWDKIAFTEYDAHLKKILNFLEKDFEGVVFVKNDLKEDDASEYLVARLLARSIPISRLAKIKIKNIKEPVPLRSMGEGMLRVLQLALKLPSAAGGILLIDEFENGLHFSIQEKIWEWLFDLATEFDIQIFATTHSSDCIKSFARVAAKRKNEEGILFRIGRSVKTSDAGKVIATEFNAQEIAGLIRADIELR